MSYQCLAFARELTLAEHEPPTDGGHTSCEFPNEHARSPPRNDPSFCLLAPHQRLLETPNEIGHTSARKDGYSIPPGQILQSLAKKQRKPLRPDSCTLLPIFRWLQQRYCSP